MDITKFCSDAEPYNGRFPITRPWIKGGWRYATDVRIAVREKTDEPDGAPGYPEVEALFAAVSPGVENLAVLPTHDGTGTDWEEPACELIEDPTTKTCKHWGNCPATHDGECTNRVKGRTPADQRFAGKKWGGKYIELINSELPGAYYAVTPNGWMRFVCGDIEGMLAPLKERKDSP